MTTGAAKEAYKEGAQESKEAAKAGKPGVGFANAIPVLKAGRRVARHMWNQEDVPEPTYISVVEDVLTVQRPMGARPYQLSWEDVIAEDWVEVSEPKVSKEK